MTEECQTSFDTLKAAISQKLVLKLSNLEQRFEVVTNASDKAIRGVLQQGGQPKAFESWKLKEVETSLLVWKEMMVVVHCLRVQRVYLFGSKFITLWTKQLTPCSRPQKKLSPKQARWQEFLIEYDFEWLQQS